MNFEIRDATLSDAIYVAENLRDEDREELAGLGHSPFNVIHGFIISEDCFVVLNNQKEVASIVGLVPDGSGNAAVWALCTPAIETMGRTWIRRARQVLEERTAPFYNMLWAYTDSRNTLHHRFLKFTGFTGLRAVPQAPYHIPYIEVVKLCATP